MLKIHALVKACIIICMKSINVYLFNLTMQLCGKCVSNIVYLSTRFQSIFILYSCMIRFAHPLLSMAYQSCDWCIICLLKMADWRECGRLIWWHKIYLCNVIDLISSYRCVICELILKSSIEVYICVAIIFIWIRYRTPVRCSVICYMLT